MTLFSYDTRVTEVHKSLQNAYTYTVQQPKLINRLVEWPLMAHQQFVSIFRTETGLDYGRQTRNNA